MDFTSTFDHLAHTDDTVPDIVSYADEYQQYSSGWHYIWTLPFHIWLGLMIGLGVSLLIVKGQARLFDSMLLDLVETTGKIIDIENGKMTYTFNDFSQSNLIAHSIIAGYCRDLDSSQCIQQRAKYIPEELQNLIIRFVGQRAFFEHIECQRRVQSTESRLSSHSDLVDIKYNPIYPLIHYRLSEVPICWTGKRFLGATFYILVIRGSALAFVSLVYGCVIALSHDGYPWNGFLVTAWTVAFLVTVTVLWIGMSYCYCLCGGSLRRQYQIGEVNDERPNTMNALRPDPLNAGRSIDLSVCMDGHNDTVHLAAFNRNGTYHGSDRKQGARGRVVYEPLGIRYS